MTALLLRLEWRTAVAAARRAIRHPTRRTLWAIVAAAAALAVAVEIATSERASRNLGSWAPSLASIVGVVLAILAVAALAGRGTELPYGTRAPDATWWRYAGVGSDAGRRATTVLLTVRVAVLAMLVAVPCAIVFASADVHRAGTVVTMALAAMIVAPLAVAVSATTAKAPADETRIVAVRAPAFGSAGENGATQAKAAVPRGLAAARWLVAVRRREPLVPYVHLAGGALAGALLPAIAVRAGGQATALAVVIGGFALLLDGAFRRTTAPATLLTPWWRSALGTSPRAIVAWAFADASAVAAFGAGAAFALGIALGAPLLGIAAIPLVALVPVAVRTTALAADALFPGDRRGPGAFVRVLAVGGLAVLVATAALAAGAAGGAPVAIAAATVLILATVACGAAYSSRRLAAAMGL